MNSKDFLVGSDVSKKELDIRKGLIELFKECPIPENELLLNLGLFINRQAMSRLLYRHELYKKIIDVHGIVIEFGVRWGQSLALFESFRGMYEPYNYNRKIVGFDTFQGFPSIDEKDGNSDLTKVGAYAVTQKYEEYLNKILEYHEQESPISHIKKFELVKGDATIEIEKYLKENPETIIAFAYFDFDLYEPTAKCLKAISGHVTKGTVIGFDELNCREFPGETLALKDVFGLDKYQIKRSILDPLSSYITID